MRRTLGASVAENGAWVMQDWWFGATDAIGGRGTYKSIGRAPK